MSIKKKIAIYITGVAVLAGAIVAAIILPTIKDIKAINNQVLTEKIDLEKKYLRGQLLKKTIENFERIKPQEEKLEKIYIEPGQELGFVTTLENIASRHQLAQDISLTDAKSGATATYEPLALRITTNGPLLASLGYLRDLERLPVYFNIHEISIKNDIRASSANSPISITNTGQAFKLKAVEPADQAAVK